MTTGGILPRESDIQGASAGLGDAHRVLDIDDLPDAERTCVSFLSRSAIRFAKRHLMHTHTTTRTHLRRGSRSSRRRTAHPRGKQRSPSDPRCPRGGVPPPPQLFPPPPTPYLLLFLVFQPLARIPRTSFSSLPPLPRNTPPPAEGELSLEMRTAINACTRGLFRGLEAVAEREAAMLQATREERAAMLQAQPSTVGHHAFVPILGVVFWEMESSILSSISPVFCQDFVDIWLMLQTFSDKIRARKVQLGEITHFRKFNEGKLSLSGPFRFFL